MPEYRRLPFALLLILGLSACATTAPTVNPLLEERALSLEAVRDDALALAESLGPEQVLVVFDIDNTLLAMTQGLGADQWYEWQDELGDSDRCDERFVGDVLAAQGALYFASAMRPTEPDAPQWVRDIQAAGLPVIALTSRGPGYRLQTFRELRRAGYRFDDSGIGPGGIPADDFIPPSGKRASRYEDGVFLTAGQHKGDMLYDLLELTNTAMPSVVVMADDKVRNLQAVIDRFKPLGVPVRAWRYAGEDQNVDQFDAARAAHQWQLAEPALRALQDLFGPAHYSLPPPVTDPDCQN